VIDLHSHLLPGVDDGARSVEQALSVLRRMASEGVTAIALTPHLLASEAARGTPPHHQRAFEALKAGGPPAEVALHRGAEVMLDRPLSAIVAEQRAVTLNGTRYLLVEFPRQVANQTVEHALALVGAIGLVPVLAHPERYSCCTPETVRRWRGAGALMQVDGPTLLSSGRRGARARALLAEGLADLAAGDNHGDDRGLQPAHAALVSQGAVVQADLLFRRNPAAILDDQPTEAAPPFTLTLSLLSRVRTLLDGSGQERT
jgi:protein-tyrosine phosphatase